MLKLKRNGKNNGNGIVESILNNHGIKDTEKFINILDENVEMTKTSDYFNMEKAIKELDNWERQNIKIGVVIDDDADGYTSSAMLIQFLKEKNKKENLPSEIIPIISPKKEHGFCKVFEAGIEVDVIVVPDAGSNDVEYIKNLLHLGKKILIIDHHDVEKEAQEFFEQDISKPCILTNCMYKSPKANKELTGVGVVYKLLTGTNDLFNTEYKVSKSLFAIGEIGDNADVSNLEIRKIMCDGLFNIDNKFLKAFFKSKLTNPVAPIELSYSIIPKINAVARIGESADRLEIIKALSESYKGTIEVEKRKKSKTDGKFHHVNVKMNYYNYLKETFDKIKTKQDRFVKKEIENIDYLADENFVLGIISSDDDNIGSVTGLIANKIMSKTQKPVILVQKIDEKYFGSLRAPGNLQFKTILNGSKLFNFVAGHEQAAGVSFNEDKLDDIINHFSKYDFGLDSQTVIVDKIYKDDTNGLKADAENILDKEFVFGGKIPNPVLGFSKIYVDRNKIYSRGKTASFYFDGVKMMMFNGEELKDLISIGFSNGFYFTIVGSVMTDWQGNPMIAIDYFQKEKNDKKPSKVKKEDNFGVEITDDGKMIF